MLKIYRNSIYFLAPLCLLSIIGAAVLNYYASFNNTWFDFWSNTLLGVFGSSLLTLIISIVSYKQEKFRVLEDYYLLLRKIAMKLGHYKYIKDVDIDKVRLNINLLESIFNEDLDELGNIFARMSFLIDYKKIRLYAYGYYNYVLEIRMLTVNNIRLIKAGVKDVELKNFVDKVIFDIKVKNIQGTKMTDISNRAQNNLLDEIDTMHSIVYKLDKKPKHWFKQYDFNITVLNDEIFKKLPAMYEELLQKMVDMANEVGNINIPFTALSEVEIDYFWNDGYILSKTTSVDTTETTSIKITDKALYYFDLKNSYDKRWG